MKYELTTDTIVVNRVSLYRIKAVRSFLRIKEGDLGGYVEKEGNLSHEGDAWVLGDAQVLGDARVSGDAWVLGDARVLGNAWVSGNARVYGDAWVLGDAWVSGDARVLGNARVSGKARVYGDAWVLGDAQVSGNTSFLHVGPAKSSGRYTTAFVDDVIGVRVVCGCFSGSVPEFAAAIEATHAQSPAALKQYRLFCQLIAANFEE